MDDRISISSDSLEVSGEIETEGTDEPFETLAKTLDTHLSAQNEVNMELTSKIGTGRYLAWVTIHHHTYKAKIESAGDQHIGYLLNLTITSSDATENSDDIQAIYENRNRLLTIIVDAIEATFGLRDDPNWV